MNVCEVAIEDSDDEFVKIKNKRRKTSELWNYFSAVSREHALCDLCHQKFSYKTSTSNLRKHILCRHKDKKLHSSDDKRSKSRDESFSSGHFNDDEVDDSLERLTIKKEPLKKNDLPSRGGLTNFLSFKNNSWDRGKINEGDEYDVYGITVAAKLRKMEEKQRLFCERIINEALYKGALDQLTPLSDIVICIPGNT